MPLSGQAGLSGDRLNPQAGSGGEGLALAAVTKVRAVEFIRRMRGASQPQMLRCDDGANYIVKFQNNPQHVRVLANESFAGRLALRIGVPVPPLAFVDMAPELIQGNPALEIQIGSHSESCAPNL